MTLCRGSTLCDVWPSAFPWMWNPISPPPTVNCSPGCDGNTPLPLPAWRWLWRSEPDLLLPALEVCLPGPSPYQLEISHGRTLPRLFFRMRALQNRCWLLCWEEPPLPESRRKSFRGEFSRASRD